MSGACAIVLAAGFGSRLQPVTTDRPKSMVPLAGRTLLDRQIEVFQACGVQDVAIVLGHGAGAVTDGRLRRFHNPDYRSTNMVASLMCARDLFDGGRDIVVSYGDIAYERRVLNAVLGGRHAISVAVDRRWRRLWDLRMEDPLSDAETMRLSADGHILELGKKPSSLAEIEGQYMGLFRIEAATAPGVLEFYEALDRGRLYDGRDVPNMFMTSFLQAMIDARFDVGAALVENGWLEIDTLSDLERYEALAAAGRLAEYYDDRL